MSADGHPCSREPTPQSLPWRDCHLQNASLTSCFRNRSIAEIPAECSFSTLRICSSVNLHIGIGCRLAGEPNANFRIGGVSGEQVRASGKFGKGQPHISKYLNGKATELRTLNQALGC